MKNAQELQQLKIKNTIPINGYAPSTQINQKLKVDKKENNLKRNNMKTAVEWLINELKTSIHYQRVINEVNQSSTDVKDVIKQAKQISDDFSIGFAEFSINYNYHPTQKVWIRYDKMANEKYTSTQLLEIYKKEKGL